MADIFDRMVEKWPSELVANSEVRAFTGGVITGKTLQNQAAKGEDVPPVFHIGKKAVREAAAIAAYLRRRARG